MSTESTLRTITRHLGLALAPLRAALQDAESFRTFCFELGFDVESIPPAYSNLVDALNSLVTAIEQDDVDRVVTHLRTIAGALGQTFPAPDGDTNVTDAGRKLLDLLIIDYFKLSLPTIFQLLRATGVVTQTFVPEGPGRPAFIEKRVHYDQFPAFLSDPLGKVKEILGWAAAQFGFPIIAGMIMEAANSRGFRAHIERPDGDLAAGYLDPQQAEVADYALDVILFEAPLGDTFVELGAKLLELPGDNPGFALQPLVTRQLDIPLSEDVHFEADTNVDQLFGILFRPGETPTVRFPFAAETVRPQATVALTVAPATPKVLLGSADASRLEIRGAKTAISVRPSGDTFDVTAEITTIGTKAVLKISEGDGFLSTVLGAQNTEIPFELSVRWSSEAGISFGGSGKFEVALSPNLTVGPVHLSLLTIGVHGRPAEGTNPPALVAQAGADIAVTIGPVVATVTGVGVELDLGFGDGNVGPFDLDVGFKPPTGVGVAVNAGPVHGGGFISFEPDLGRYSGALELSIYDISVKAFGLIETKVPGVSFSFVIVISAEFTPIQLGFGFTLNGVGGLVGINRTVNSTELRKLVLEGRSENLLFPKNLIANAPTIIRDLGTVFPARQSHYVFGPLGKLGWGTPTLITGEIGVIIEIPGVVAILGEVKILLPKPDVPLVKMNMSVGGTLDFPNKTFSLDAALHDSIIEGYPISGQMALRVKWGEAPNFVASIGGFHPSYQPPKDFPKLQPMTLDLGQHGRASVTVTGFFAVTSNTVQVGGDARLHAEGSGISLDASVSVKALFVFSPFHFEATVDAGVKISFHGYGPSVHLHGVLEGPAPWHIRGELCVSIIFWDACLGFDETFGEGQPASVPEIDPWDPQTPDVVGLKAALQDAGNWSGVVPAGTASVVSRAQGSEALVDPVGGMSVHQKAVPVETDHPISRFGVAKVKTPVVYTLVGATFGTQTTPPPPTLKTLAPVSDFFAPAQFFQMDDGKKLSAPGFEQQQAGYVLGENNNNLRAGSNATVDSNYTTYIIAADGTISDPQFDTTPQGAVTGQNKRSAMEMGGVTQLGTRRFIDRLITQAFDVRPPRFILSNNNTLAAIVGGQTPTSRTSALLSMDTYRLQNPAQRLQVQVSALHELA